MYIYKARTHSCSAHTCAHVQQFLNERKQERAMEVRQLEDKLKSRGKSVPETKEDDADDYPGTCACVCACVRVPCVICQCAHTSKCFHTYMHAWIYILHAHAHTGVCMYMYFYTAL